MATCSRRVHTGVEADITKTAFRSTPVGLRVDTKGADVGQCWSDVGRSSPRSSKLSAIGFQAMSVRLGRATRRCPATPSAISMVLAAADGLIQRHL